MCSERDLFSFLSFVGPRLSPGCLPALLFTTLLLVPAAPIDARPICASVVTLPLDSWTELGNSPSEYVYEVEAPMAGTLFFAWREAETPARTLVPHRIDEPCEAPNEPSAAAPRNLVVLPRAGVFQVRFGSLPTDGDLPFPTEVLAHFRPIRQPTAGTIEESIREGLPHLDAEEALACLERLQALEDPSGADSSLLFDPTAGSPSTPSSIEEWEIDILSLDEDPEEGDPLADPVVLPPSGLEEWEIDILTFQGEPVDPESLWPAWEQAVRWWAGIESPGLPQDPMDALEQVLAANPEAHVAVHWLLVGRPGSLEVDRNVGGAIGLLRALPDQPSRWIELALPESEGAVRAPVVPGLYALVEVVEAGSRGIDASGVRIFEICP